MIPGHGNAVERVSIRIFQHLQAGLLLQCLDELLRKAQSLGYDRRKMIIIAILPARAPVIRTRVKHWGDVTTGVFA